MITVPVKPKPTTIHKTSLTPQPGYVRRVCYTCHQPFYRERVQASRYDHPKGGRRHRDYCSVECFRDQAWGNRSGKRIICRCSRCTIPFDDGDFKRVSGKDHCAQCEREIPLGHVGIGDFIRDSGYFVRLGDMTERESIDQMCDHTNQPRRRGRPRGL